MNDPSKTRTAKGLSVEGFWRELQDKTVSTDSAPDAINASVLTQEPIELYEAPKHNDNCVARFDEWLERL